MSNINGAPAPDPWAAYVASADPWAAYVSPAAPADRQVAISAIPGIMADGANDAVNAVAHAIPFGDRISAAMNTLPLVGSGKTYDQNLADERAQAARDKQQNPELQVAANAGVGAALAGPAMAAETAGGAIGSAALTGMGYGAVQGASDTPDLTQSVAQDALNVGKGAAVGGVAGGVLGAGGALVGKAAQKAAAYLTPQVGDLSKASNGLLYKAMSADGGPSVEAAAAKLGPDANVMDASPGATALGQGVTGKLGVDSGAITTPLADRANLTNTRVNGDVNAAVGPAPPSANIASAELGAQKAPISGGLPGVYAAANQAGGVNVQPVIDDVAAQSAASNNAGANQKALAHIKELLTKPGPPPPDPGAPPSFPPPNPATGGVTWAQNQAWQQATAQHAADTAAYKAAIANPASIPRVPETDLGKLHEGLQNIRKMRDYTASTGTGPWAGMDASNDGVIGTIEGNLSRSLKDQSPDYAKAMEGLSSINRQQTAIKAGEESLGSGRAATNPNDFKQAYGDVPQGPTAPGSLPSGAPVGAPLLRTPEQAATNTGMRAAIDTAVGTKPNDFSALKVLLQGVPEDASTGVGAGFNNQNIGHAFGPDAQTALQNTVNREQAFATTNNAISGNSLTNKRIEMTEALGDAVENRPLWGGEVHNVSTHGIPLKIAQATVNKIAAPFQGHVDAPAIYKELAGALTSSGPARAKMIADVMQNGPNAASTAAVGRASRRAALLAAGIGAGGAK